MPTTIRDPAGINAKGYGITQWTTFSRQQGLLDAAKVAGKPESELTKAIENGNSTSTPKMPSFKEKLTADDIRALVAEIKALK